MYQYFKTFLIASMVFIVKEGLSQNVVTITGGASINMAGNASLTLQDFDLENNGTINLAAGSGRIIFRGSANNRIRGNGVTGLDQLEVAKAGNAKLLLDKNMEVRSGIWFTSGQLDLNNRNIVLFGNAALFNESENSFLTGTSGGYIEISRQLNNTSLNPGNLGAMITTSQNAGLTVIRRGHMVQTIGAGLSSIQRYYDIIPENNTALSAQLRFYYRDAELNGSNEAQLDLQRSTDNVNWTNRGASNRNATMNYVELNNISQFSRWTLAAVGTPLPVLFIDFDAACQNGAVFLTWSTGQEINASHFEVQASQNGSSWTTIGSVPAAGNSQSVNHYHFNDPAMSGKFYRIREVDVDGQSQLTSVQLADCNQSGWKVWPNPVDDHLQISMMSIGNDRAVINVYDNLGRLVISKPVGLSPGNNQIQLPVHTLQAGHYLIEMTWKEGSERKQSRFVKR